MYKVSKLLGHSNVRVTEKIYAPIPGKFLAQEASKLGRYMGLLLLREVPDAKPVRAKKGLFVDRVAVTVDDLESDPVGQAMQLKVWRVMSSP